MRFRGGAVDSCDTSDEWYWEHDGNEYDIVAYSVIGYTPRATDAKYTRGETMSTHENGGKDRPMAHGKPDNLRPVPNSPEEKVEALGKAIDERIEERDKLREDRDLWMEAEAACSRNYNELLEERDVYAMAAERWWRQARQNNQDARSNASIASAAIDELRKEVEQLAKDRYQQQRRAEKAEAEGERYAGLLGKAARTESELRAEVEQYKWLLEQAKTLRQDNMRMHDKLTRISPLAGGIRVLTGKNSNEHSLATSIAQIANEALQPIGETVSQNMAKRSST